MFRRRSRHHAGAIPRGEARGGQGSAVRPRYDPRPTSPRQPVSHCGRARIRGLALRPPGALRAPRASRRAIARFHSSRGEVARAIAPSHRVNCRTPRAPRAPRRAPRQRLQINPTREEHRDRVRPTDLPVPPRPPHPSAAPARTTPGRCTSSACRRSSARAPSAKGPGRSAEARVRPIARARPPRRGTRARRRPPRDRSGTRPRAPPATTTTPRTSRCRGSIRTTRASFPRARRARGPTRLTPEPCRRD